MFSSKISSNGDGQENNQKHLENEPNSEILLNSFLIKKKRCRVLLHFDKIIWEEEEKRNNKNELSIYDIISVYESKNGQKKPPIPQHSSTMSTFPQDLNRSTSSTFQLTSTEQQQHHHEFSNLAFQINDEEIKQFYSNDTIINNHELLEQNQSIINENTTNSEYLIINYAKRLKDSRNQFNRWDKKTIVLNNCDTNIIRNWYKVLQNILIKQNRPQKLLMFINPYGGKKNSSEIYEKFCKPIFQLANIDVICIKSQRPNQIRDIIMQQCLDDYDGICCVGGDGTFAELFNGLIFRTIKDLKMNSLQPNYIPKPKLPIGIIPGGSTNTVVYCLHGTCDPTTAAIHIVLGQRRGLDLASVQNSNGLIRLYASVLSYGYLGDIALDSEKFRWMGPKRYDYSGFKKFFSNRGYNGEIKLFDSSLSSTSSSSASSCSSSNDSVAQPTIINHTDISTKTTQNVTASNDSAVNEIVNENNNLSNNEKCYVDCLRCTKNLNQQEDDKKNINESTNNSIASTSLKTSTITLNQNNNDNDNVCKTSTIDEITTTKDCDIKMNNSKNLIENNYEKLSNDIKLSSIHNENFMENNWKIVKGKYFLVCGANISCACARSPNGLSPNSHLGDGFLNIILVPHTTLFNNLRLLLAMGNKNSGITDLPFVEIHRTKKFLFRASKSPIVTQNSNDDLNRLNTGSCQPISNSINGENDFTSQWNCDGEVILDSDVFITSHRQLIDVFMRGPYPSDETNSSKCC